jgi:peptidoglycan/xylan/chitin deacetylase (PgdA/CDA1 family)
MEPRAYGPYPYRPIAGRAPLAWPDGARIAFWVVPNIETFALDERVPGGTDRIPDVSAWGRRDYGNRVGVFRMMEAMARHGVRGTVALNSEVCDACPEIIAACMDLGWEFMGHGESNTRRLHEAGSEQQAADVIRRTLDRIEATTGARPRGWLGPGREQTWTTLDVLADEGCVYTADWDSDDQPVLMDIGGRPFVSLPYGAGVSDLQAFTLSHFTADDFERMTCRAFDVLYRESAEIARVAAISLHPFIIGLPHRIGALERALEHITAHDGVWRATGSEIADHFLGLQQAG